MGIELMTDFSKIKLDSAMKPEIEKRISSLFGACSSCAPEGTTIIQITPTIVNEKGYGMKVEYFGERGADLVEVAPPVFCGSFAETYSVKDISKVQPK